MERLILAHDIGTSGNKATLFSEDGGIVASTVHPYRTYHRHGGVAEQNPDDWWAAVVVTTRKLLEDNDASRIAAIACSGTMMGCLPMDRSGRPLRNHMLYCDQRAAAEADWFAEKAGAKRIYEISGNPPNAVNSGPKYIWLKRHEPNVYNQTHKILNSKDYVGFKLTGRMATDPTDASGTNLYDLARWEWSEELIDAAGLDKGVFPDIVPSTGVLGELTRAAADELGLRHGIPVMMGAADGMCAGVGAGSVAPGVIYTTLGSSAWVGITTDAPILDSKQRTLTYAHAVPGMFQPMGTMLVGGGIMPWIRDRICAGEVMEAEKTGVDIFEIMSREIESSPAGANSLIFLPHLMGERAPRWNSHARGGFIGMNMAHTRADMLRACLEGVVLNLVLTIDVFRELDYRFDEIRFIGGAAKGAVWRRIMADIFNMDVLPSEHGGEATSIGAAIIAGIGAGMYKDFSVVERFSAASNRTKPNPENVPMYEKKKDLFNRVYEALEPLFPEFK